MEEGDPVGRRLCFGIFEVDLRAGELRKRGLRVRLQQQPFQVLAMLLEHTGQPAAGARIMKAVQQVTGTKMKSQAAGKMGFGTKEVGDLVIAAL